MKGCLKFVAVILVIFVAAGIGIAMMDGISGTPRPTRTPGPTATPAPTATSTPTVEELTALAVDFEYDHLFRNIAEYKDVLLKGTGRAVQVLPEDKGITFRIANNGEINDMLLAHCACPDQVFREGDQLAFIGRATEMYTYEGVLGNKITLPLLRLDHVEIFELVEK